MATQETPRVELGCLSLFLIALIVATCAGGSNGVSSGRIDRLERKLEEANEKLDRIERKLNR